MSSTKKLVYDLVDDVVKITTDKSAPRSPNTKLASRNLVKANGAFGRVNNVQRCFYSIINIDAYVLNFAIIEDSSD